MRNLWLAVALLVVCLPAWGRGKLQSFCMDGGIAVTIPGTQGSGTQRFMRSYVSCTVTVYLTGTTTLATIYSDNASTPKANPFTAASDGLWFFYIDNGVYDVKLSGGGITTPFTLGAFTVTDPTVTVNCNTFSGADGGIQVTNCIAATPAGGIADATQVPTGTWSAIGTVNRRLILPGVGITYTGTGTFMTCSSSDIIISGQRNLTTITAASVTSDLIVFNGCDQGILSDIKLSGNTASTASLVKVTNTTDAMLDNIYMVNSGTDGVLIDGASGNKTFFTRLNNVDINCGTAGARNGVRTTTSGSTTPTTTRMLYGRVRNCFVGYNQVQTASQTDIITGTDFEGNTTGIKIAGGDNTFLGIRCESNTTDINLLAGSFDNQLIGGVASTGAGITDNGTNTSYSAFLNGATIKNKFVGSAFAGVPILFASSTYVEFDYLGGSSGLIWRTAAGGNTEAALVSSGSANNATMSLESCTAGTCTSRLDVNPTTGLAIPTGIYKDGAGFQHIVKTSVCTTAASVAATCDTTITWNTAFADTSYTATCTLTGALTGVPTIVGAPTKSATQFIVRIAALTAAAATSANLDCIAVHQ